ncbi:MAG: dihydrolipoamide acetyltransferase family protein [Ilumatobacteraceae bacterium]
MATEFTMPKLGLTMEEGTIVEWLVPDGADVDEGSPVLVIQTDKVETEVNVVGSGRLQQVAGVGDTLACGEVVGVLLGAGEAAPAGNGGAQPATTVATTTTEPPPEAETPAARTAVAAQLPGADGRQFVSPNARRVAAELGVDVTTVGGTGPGGRIVSEDVEEAAAAGPRVERSAASAGPGAAPSRTTPHVSATFAGRALADLVGVDIATVPAASSDGRVSREDVAAHVRALLATAASGDAPAPTAATQPPTSVTPLRGMRGTIAKRMHQSLREMAQLTLTMDADFDAVVADRAARKERGAAPGYTDYVIAAAAKALRQHPHVNAQITPDGVALLPDVHVGMAVALDGGLVVPVVRQTDRRTLEDLSAETTRLAEAARAGKLTLDELEGGTFSVSALGMFGVDAFTPVINPPNVAILGVGRLRDDLVLSDDGVVVVKVARMTLSLTWDHRAFDGAPAAEFAKAIVTNLADPTTL